MPLQIGLPEAASFGGAAPNTTAHAPCALRHERQRQRQRPVRKTSGRTQTNQRTTGHVPINNICLVVLDAAPARAVLPRHQVRPFPPAPPSPLSPSLFAPRTVLEKTMLLCCTGIYIGDTPICPSNDRSLLVHPKRYHSVPIYKVILSLF